MPKARLGVFVVVLTVVPCAPAAQQTPPRDTAKPVTGATATVGGRVVDRETGEPLRRMRVVFYRRGAAPGESPVEATTGADGRYEVSGLLPGQYSASVQPGEYRGGYRAASLGIDDDSPPAFNRPPALDLKPGDVRRSVDFTMARSYAIEGRVLNEYGEPLSDVMVAADPIETTGAAYARMLRTDDRGVFRLYGLSPGRYNVCAGAGEDPWSSRQRGEEPQQLRYVRTCHPSAGSPSAATLITIKASDATGVTIQMQRGRTYTLSGSIVRESGAPAEHASVSIDYAEQRYPRGYMAGVEYRQGTFVARGVAAGEYLVRVTIAEPGTSPGPASNREYGYARVVVEASDVSDLVVRTSSGASTAGRVVFDDEPPPGRPRLTVAAARPVDGDPLFNNVMTPNAPVSDDSTFQLKGIHGPVVVSVSGLPAGWIVKAVRHGETDILQVPTEFKTGDPRQLEVVVTKRVARLTVRPLDAKAQPMPTALIVLMPADPRRAAGFLLPSEPAAPDGTITFPPLRPDAYLVAAIVPEQGRELLRRRKELMDAVRSRAQRITLAANEHPAVDVRVVRLPEIER